MSGTHLFVIGRDYHLGDLLWLTAVLAEYRRQRDPAELILAAPNGPIHAILDGSPVVDRLVLGADDSTLRSVWVQARRPVAVHDLRPIPVALAMLADWRHHLPWLYYRDLWAEPRGQWLATFLHLGRMQSYRPQIALRGADRATARSLPEPYIALAPHIGQYRLPLAGSFWSKVKGWPIASWQELAVNLRDAGYELVSLGAAGQEGIPGTRTLTGLPIRQVAGIIEGASCLVSGESGLWFVAAATQTPFVIVPWWLPAGIDWAAPVGVPHQLVRRDEATVVRVRRAIADVMGESRREK